MKADRKKISDVIIALGALNALIAVAAGAFAAHGLKNLMNVEYINTFKTAADYQISHGLGLILIGILHQESTGRSTLAAAITMLAGIVLFSGSLYVLTLTGIKWLGFITPFGGGCFLLAWLILVISFLSNKTEQ